MGVRPDRLLGTPHEGYCMLRQLQVSSDAPTSTSEVLLSTGVPGPVPSSIGVGARARDLGCVILSGGLGTRLREVVADRPKSMALVGGRPFIEWLLLALRHQGVTRVTLATGHLGDQLRDHLGDGSALGVRLTYSQEDTPLGTGGALRLALENTHGTRVLVLNGDTYCRLDLDRLLTAHVENGAPATLQLAYVEDTRRYGTVEVTDDGLVSGFAEKHGDDAPGWVSAGVYVVDRSVLEAIEPGVPVSLEREVIPGLAGAGLRALVGSGPFVDIGTPHSLAAASEELRDELASLRSPDEPATTLVQRRLGDTIAVQRAVMATCSGDIVRAARRIAEAYARGGKLLLCGNGGSAGDCQHMAAELMSRLRSDVARRALPAIALTTDTSFLTAFANDYEYEGVFARQVEGLALPGDVLLGISTSGRSRNVVQALEFARNQGLVTIALTGAGGTMAQLADVAIEIPSRGTQTVQECMLSIEHIICELVEDGLFGGRDLHVDGDLGGAAGAR